MDLFSLIKKLLQKFTYNFPFLGLFSQKNIFTIFIKVNKYDIMNLCCQLKVCMCVKKIGRC